MSGLGFGIMSGLFSMVNPLADAVSIKEFSIFREVIVRQSFVRRLYLCPKKTKKQNILFPGGPSNDWTIRWKSIFPISKCIASVMYDFIAYILECNIF